MSNPTDHNGSGGPDDLPVDGRSAPSADSQPSSGQAHGGQAFGAQGNGGAQGFGGAQGYGGAGPSEPQAYGAQPYGTPAYGQPYGSQHYGAPAYGQQFGAQPYGAPQYGVQPYVQPYGAMQPYGQASLAARKDPALMLIASFFIPGLGTILNGETGKGIGILAGYLIGIPLTLILIGVPMVLGFWIWGMVDAYQGAQNHNARHGLP